MKFSNKLTLMNLLVGFSVVFILSFSIYKFAFMSILKTELIYTKKIANEISENLDFYLEEKVKNVQTMANMPIILNALEKSNFSYSKLPKSQRKNYINYNNQRWTSVNNLLDKFILQFTDNIVSRTFKNQQLLLKNEYGEIFLTNKFGALVASTSKLSTFAHGHKYWWLGAYKNGKGAVFFDDRGYDDSVDGYVLGIVVPVLKGKKVVGILKCNLNIIGIFSRIVFVPSRKKLFSKIKLIRSGGLVVLEHDVEPLSTRVHPLIVKKIKENSDHSIVISGSGEEYLVGVSELKLTTDKGRYGFGGNFESIDHKKGNKGESWYIICYREKNLALANIDKMVTLILWIGIIIVLVLIVISYLFSREISKPLAQLSEATKKIGSGNFKFRISLNRNDEFGILSNSFNQMADSLEKTTTSKEKAEESERIKSAFLSNMSHEIRTPLNAIIGFSELMLDKRYSSEYREFLIQIKRNSDLLLMLVNDILDFSKIQAGKTEIENIPFSMKLLISYVRLNVRSLLSQNINSVEIRECFPENYSEYISGDLLKILQVFNNLISNAVKFTKEGYIEYGFNILGDNIEFFVHDSGIGISKKEQDSIFKLFEQADVSTTRKYGGTGLGLTISKKIVELMGGKIYVNSEKGKGAIFKFEIPYIPVDKFIKKNEEKLLINNQLDNLQNYKILLVEDNPVNQLVAKKILEKFSATVLIAFNGEEAIDIFKKDLSINLILMDIQMPILDGVEATIRIREMEKKENRKRMPIVAFTAGAFNVDRDKALKSGCDDYINKPINTKRLLEVINNIIKKEEIL